TMICLTFCSTDMQPPGVIKRNDDFIQVPIQESTPVGAWINRRREVSGRFARRFRSIPEPAIRITGLREVGDGKHCFRAGSTRARAGLKTPCASADLSL